MSYFQLKSPFTAKKMFFCLSTSMFKTILSFLTCMMGEIGSYVFKCPLIYQSCKNRNCWVNEPTKGFTELSGDLPNKDIRGCSTLVPAWSIHPWLQPQLLSPNHRIGKYAQTLGLDRVSYKIVGEAMEGVQELPLAIVMCDTSTLSTLHSE